jgi:hypothetical protein
MIIALLLKASGLKAMLIAYIAGTLLYTMLLFVEDRQSLRRLHIFTSAKSLRAVSIVYILTTVAGFTDFFIPLLLAYGKQYLYAAGGFAHLVRLTHCVRSPASCLKLPYLLGASSRSLLHHHQELRSHLVQCPNFL